MVGMQLTRWTTDAMFVDYSQYSLQGEDSSDYDEIQVVGRVHEGNGLVAACPEVLVVIAGTECGDVRLTTERRQDTPPPPDHAWEAAVDISMYSTSGQLWLTPLMSDSIGAAGNFAAAGPGWYRIRVQARRRAEGKSGSALEEHYVGVWPAPPEPDRVWATDDMARHSYDPHRPPHQPIQPDDPAWFRKPERFPQEPRPHQDSPQPRRHQISPAALANIEQHRRRSAQRGASPADNLRRRRRD
jgi:hypothetical protein